jgi:nucleobase:cation symporter-1, NCS1 family
MSSTLKSPVSTAEVEEIHDKPYGEESLAPQEARIMDRWSYFFAWLGGCVSIGTFTAGSSLVGTLNLLQSTLAIAIGCFVIGVFLAINGAAGHKYGIPFMVQARSAFGFAGTRLPGLIRAVPALVWYGFQSWIGAGALNTCSAVLFGYSNIWLFFIGFQALQIGLSVLGFHGIKWLENIGSFFIIACLIYMFISVVGKYGEVLGDKLVGIEGSWGIEFWGATMLFLGIYSTMMLNVSDYSRELHHDTKRGILVTIYSLSILPATLFMGLIGVMVSTATGVVDPIEVFTSAVDNKPLLITTLLFIAFAQVTTNILNNCIPPTYVMMDIFGFSFKKASVITGVLAFATCPWLLVTAESADGLIIFIKTYSAFIGPILAVLIVDYYLIRNRTLIVSQYYDSEGPYKGINWAAYIAVFAGVPVALYFSNVSFYASLLPSAIVYYLLMKSKMVGSERFCQ